MAQFSKPKSSQVVALAFLACALILGASSAKAKGAAVRGGGAVSGKAVAADGVSPAAPLGTGTVVTGVNGGVVIFNPTTSPVYAGTGLGTNLYAPFVPGTLLPGVLPMSPLNPYAGMPPVYNPSPLQQALGMVQGACSLTAGLMGAAGDQALQRAAADRDIADYANDHTPPYYPSGVSRSQAARYGGDLANMYGNMVGCENFVTKDGKIGPWGSKALETMHGKASLKNIYEDKVPPDMDKFCPEFQGMDKGRRDYFWLWFFASLSKPESGCKSGAVGQGPNGKAIGLFQLEADKCQRVGVNVSSQELLNPDRNIECAVALFGNEMATRQTMQVNTSRGSRGTYWAAMRTNPYGAADASAGAQTKSLLQHWPDCQKTNETSTLRAPASK